MSATSEHTQTTIGEESAKEHTRRRAQEHLERTGGPSPTTRFLQSVPPDTELDELEDLWPVYVDAVGGVER